MALCAAVWTTVTHTGRPNKKAPGRPWPSILASRPWWHSRTIHWTRLCAFSVAGNIIDLGVTHEYDLHGTLDRVMLEPFAIEPPVPLPAGGVRPTGEILYIGDNAGETVFDRILIETLDVPVTYVVRGGPIINDVTREDAVAAGLDRVATIVDSGAPVPGVLLNRCSEEFQHRFNSAHLIIAKGQGNYESLSGSGAPVFFALQTKCPIIAGDLGVPLKSFILKSERVDK